MPHNGYQNSLQQTWKVGDNQNRNIQTLVGKDQLNDLVKKRNRASRERLKYQSDETRKECHHHQQKFKQKVKKLKNNHWRKFLAKKGPDHVYQAHRFTKDRQRGQINSLKDHGGNLTSDISEKSLLLFRGISIVETTSNLQDIPEQQPPRTPLEFPWITKDVVTRTINSLPHKKAPRPDGIQNEQLKLSHPLLVLLLTNLFNTCIKQES
ncbi:hypothetical protein O181_018167 [Austropuccinia psidii MF-1]|uniref:Uncharacterized protein n=1 Tax=Austropuccinia psidii MF-1 TaxID=1389203 RepID=A0A9Q3GT91_9BASI|nr:hypothetical protein [Austropuccinia psidii MF-1]